MPTITWITEKELERVIVNKRDAGISLEEKHENLVAAVRKWEMLAASKERQWAAVKKTESDQEQQKVIQQFLLKKCVTRKFHVLVVQTNGKEMYKKVCCTCKFVFC